MHALFEMTVAFKEGGESDDDVDAVVDIVDAEFNVDAGAVEVVLVVDVEEDNVVVFFVLAVEPRVVLAFGAVALEDE